MSVTVFKLRQLHARSTTCSRCQRRAFVVFVVEKLMEANVLSLPESFDTADGGGGRHGSRGPRNKLPQWLVLYTVLANEREHAETTHLCRATDVFENWSNATPAELHEIANWHCHLSSQRKRDRQNQTGSSFKAGSCSRWVVRPMMCTSFCVKSQGDT